MKNILFYLTLLLTTSYSYSQSGKLKTYSQQELHLDFDLLVSALKEAHAGLYWYNTIAEFDNLVAIERAKIKEGMNSYEFFKIASKIVTSTKEGHCRIGSSRDIGEYFNQNALIVPLSVKVLNNQVFILNNIQGFNTRGQVLTSINGQPIEQIIETILDLTPKYADGNNTIGKIRWSIDYSSLAYYYADFFENRKINSIGILDPNTNDVSLIDVKSVSAKQYSELNKQIRRPGYSKPIALSIDTKRSTAYLAIHSFRHTNYDQEGNEEVAFSRFSAKIDSTFEAIQKSKVQNLILDIRNNSGGTEGYEDYVFSYLTSKPYSKYKYVQANSLSFSFLKHTQYNTGEKQKSFEEAMAREFYLSKDGRYLRKEGFMPVEPPQKHPFKGQLYVITSGKTYSGGSEFAALLKGKTQAIFIGEETGGGFYGQTSGFTLRLTLPHSGMRISIPLLKFVVDVDSQDIPLGRGVIPDYPIEPTFEEFSNGINVEKGLVLKLIKD